MPDTPTPQPLDLDEARHLCNAATDGPWTVDYTHSVIGAAGGKVVYSVGIHAGTYPTPPNGAFIAAARTLLPRALDELAQARAENGALHGTALAYWAEAVELRNARKQRDGALAEVARLTAVAAVARRFAALVRSGSWSEQDAAGFLAAVDPEGGAS